MLKTKARDLALLILRITFGGSMIIGHGWGKMLRLFGEGPIEFGDPYGLGPAVSLTLAAFAEFLCAALLVVGLFSRWVTIPLIIVMLTAIFMVHLGDPFSRLEKPILFLGAYIALLLAGPGAYSVDAVIERNRA